MNILITSAGRRVSLVRAFQKELKKINSKGRVITADANPILAPACHVSDDCFELPFLNHPSHLDLLLQKCKDFNINLIIPTHDAELVALVGFKDLFKKNNIDLLISSAEFIAKCRDKRAIHKFFVSKNIKVAKEFDKENYQLPLFIKPIDGSRSIDTYTIKAEKELKEYHFKNKKLMFLEYLDHELFDEYTCDLYYGKDNLLKCAVPRKRIAVRDGEVNKGLTLNNEMVPFIQHHLGHIEGAVGCLTTQFFKHKKENNIYGIEINPRFGGGFPLTYLSGANFPKWIIDEYLLDIPIEENFDCWESNLLMLRYDDEILVHGYKG